MKGRLPVSVAALIACFNSGANGERESLSYDPPLPRKTAILPEAEDSRAMTASIG
jgi:hypothetical protein